MFTMISIFKYKKIVTQYACMQRDITYLESESILACIPVPHNIALLHALCLPLLVKNKMIIQLYENFFYLIATKERFKHVN